jgi:hypothetical protein
LLKGTVDFEQSVVSDPTGLYWLPRSRESAKALISALSNFAKFISEKTRSGSNFTALNVLTGLTKFIGEAVLTKKLGRVDGIPDMHF